MSKYRVIWVHNNDDKNSPQVFVTSAIPEDLANSICMALQGMTSRFNHGGPDWYTVVPEGYVLKSWNGEDE